MSNPNWTREELIIALDLYFQQGGADFNLEKEAVESAISFLQKLTRKLGHEISRSGDSIILKTRNFRSLDPDYPGVGMSNIGRLDREIWARYAPNREELKQRAEQIRSFVDSDEIPAIAETMSDDEEEAEEGALLTRIHKTRERDRNIVKRKKNSVLKKSGRLKCEACDFDFTSRYGNRGEGFMECHHKKPVSQLKKGETTSLSDLALVCANCHRMIHRRRPWLSIDELRGILVSSAE